VFAWFHCGLRAVLQQQSSGPAVVTSEWQLSHKLTHNCTTTAASWPAGAGAAISHSEFLVIRKSFTCPKIMVQNAKFGTKTPIIGKFWAKIEILSTHNLICHKFAEIATTCCPA